MGKLLFDKRPLVVDTILASKLGLNEAIVLQQVNYWLHSSKHYRNGRKWVYNTYKQWQEQFPFWSEVTIRRIFTSLENKGLIITGNFNEMRADKTKWYSIDEQKLEGVISPCDQNDQSMRSDRSHGSDQNDQSNTRDYTEITTEKKDEEEKAAPLINPYAVFENEIGRVSPIISEDIGQWIDGGYFDEPNEMIVEAIAVAVKKGARNWTYVSRILIGWADKKIRTLSQAKAAVLEYESKQRSQHASQRGSSRVEDKLPESVKWQQENAHQVATEEKSIQDFPEISERLQRLRNKQGGEPDARKKL